MASYIHEVWYTKLNGEFMMAWQGLTYQQALLKVREMTALGYDVCIKTPPSAPRTAASTREEGEHLRMCEGTKVIPLASESANYREWLVTTHGGTRYCIIQEQEEWTLMRYARGTEQWVDSAIPVDTFLTRHRLILAN